jgi:hypothetical protein
MRYLKLLWKLICSPAAKGLCLEKLAAATVEDVPY